MAGNGKAGSGKGVTGRGLNHARRGPNHTSAGPKLARRGLKLARVALPGATLRTDESARVPPSAGWYNKGLDTARGANQGSTGLAATCTIPRRKQYDTASRAAYTMIQRMCGRMIHFCFYFSVHYCTVVKSYCTHVAISVFFLLIKSVRRVA